MNGGDGAVGGGASGSGDAGTAQPGMIVVGVDGSPSGRAALSFALAEAAGRDATVRAVTVVRLPDYWATSYPVVPPPPDEMIAAAKTALVTQLAEVVAAGDGATPQVTTVPEALVGDPATILLAAAEGADHLVVGHRGRGAVASVVLGSVGLRCVLHAPCPVTVVPAPAEAHVPTRHRDGGGAPPPLPVMY